MAACLAISVCAVSPVRFLFYICLLICAQGAELPVRFETRDGGLRVQAILATDEAGKLPSGLLTQEQGEKVLTLSLLDEPAKTPGPSILGKYERTGNTLTFTPRFPFDYGTTYRASLRRAGGETVLDYETPILAAKAPPRLLKIYPSASVLPANQLRFYLYFDRPMRGGKELFEHLSLQDEKGGEIDAPWLDDEIWDEKNNCLILYIHPGRIKRGIELREQSGPVLYEGRSYSLVVRGKWTDLGGNPIGNDQVKKFSTTKEDHSRVELSDWRLGSPPAATHDALTLTLDKIVDYRSLLNRLNVTTDTGQDMEGRIEVGLDEKIWRFVPILPWQAARYRLEVSPELEDVAGNTPLRAFDTDLVAPGTPAQSLRIEFTPR